MPLPDSEGRIARASRVLVFCILLLTLLGGPGVVAADGETKDGGTCPALVHERGSANAPDTAFERSAHGRSIALVASGCQPPTGTLSGR